MTGIWRADNVLRGLAARPAVGGTTSFGENFVAEGNAVLQNDVAFLINARVRKAYDVLAERLNADMPQSFSLEDMRAGAGRFGNPYGAEGRLDETDFDLFGSAVEGVWGLFGETPTERLRRQGVERIFAAIAADPERYGDLPQSHDDLVGPIREAAQAASLEAAEVAERASAWGGVGGFAGGMAAQFADPLVAGTAVFGAGAASGILRTMMIEGLLGGATEAVRQPGLATARNRIGSELTLGEAAANVGMGAAGAALFGGGLKVAGRGLSAAWRRLGPVDLEPQLAAMTDRELVDAVNRSYASAGAGARMAAARMEDQLEIREANPLPDSSFGRSENVQRADQAVQDALHLRPSSLAERPAAEVAAAPDPMRQGPVWIFDARRLEREPGVFQYKRDANAEGVNQSLERVGRWDSIKAGQIVVYEYADGRQVVVDGHQRHALAMRLLDAGVETEVQIVGHLLREADGVTPEYARAVGAVKNLAEGTGDAVDAAKVLRDWPDLMDETLSVGRAWIRQATDMVNLTDEAFGFIWNDVVPPHFGALVGRLIASEDEALQAAAMKALVETAPANIVQAESVVRSVASEGVDLLQQDSLFGEELIASALFGEKAELIDAALRRLRKDKGVFQTLVDRRGAIEEAGNTLAAETNLDRANIDAIAISLVQKQAHLAGSAANVALREGARRLHAGESIRSVLDDFVDAVTRAIRSGDFDGDLAGGGGRGAQADAQSPVLSERGAADADQAVDDGQFDAFAEIDGEGQTGQREALEAELKAEADRAEAAADAPGVREGGAAGGAEAPAAASRAGEAPAGSEFDTWFGDSKVVDDGGAPLVVYHGAPLKFSEAPRRLEEVAGRKQEIVAAVKAILQAVDPESVDLADLRLRSGDLRRSLRFLIDDVVAAAKHDDLGHLRSELVRLDARPADRMRDFRLQAVRKKMQGAEERAARLVELRAAEARLADLAAEFTALERTVTGLQQSVALSGGKDIIRTDGSGRTDYGWAGVGAYFTPVRTEAAGYAGPSGHVYAVHLSIKNPYVEGETQLPAAFGKDREARAQRMIARGTERNAAFAMAKTEALQALGFDGVMVRANPPRFVTDEYVAFSSDQIRIIDEAARPVGHAAAAPEPAADMLPGFVPVSDAERQALRELAPIDGDGAPPDFGLFDLGARGQRDLEDMLVPTEDVLDQIAASDDFMGQLDACRPK